MRIRSSYAYLQKVAQLLVILVLRVSDIGPFFKSVTCIQFNKCYFGLHDATTFAHWHH